jgi:succinyl-diaminopimelate desuccinylase
VEVVLPTRFDAGIADNVIPGEAHATLNPRYPPDRTPEEAEAYLRSVVPKGAMLEVLSNAPPGRVVTGSPLVDSLREAGGLELEPKQAWTNVADFTANGVDAVNFGRATRPTRTIRTSSSGYLRSSMRTACSTRSSPAGSERM